MNYYFVKIALRSVSPMVWRRLRIPGNASLAMLHECIQIINGWDDENLHRFHIYGKDYGINYIGAVCYSDDANAIYLDDFDFDVGDKFIYEYNFFGHIIHDIRIEKINKSLTNDNSIVCLKGSGMPGATKYDEMKLNHKFLKTMVAKKGKLTEKDVIYFRERLNRIKFNINQTNTILASIYIK